MKEYDTFILTDINEFQHEKEQEILIRDVNPGKRKYCSEYVRAIVSKDPDKYQDRLWPRLGKGQWVGQPWSIKIIEKVEKIPEPYR